jgi:glucosylceramidase
VGNFCFAPVHGDTNSGKLFFTNSYYYIGHFSKFIRPGAKRVSSGTTSNQLTATSFVNPDGSLVVVALNENNHNVKYTLTIGDRTLSLDMAAHSIQTIVLN